MGGPKFRAFFPFSRHNFLSSLSLSLLGSFRGILVVFEARGPEMCTFGVLGLSREVPAFKNTTKIQRKDPQERERRMKTVAGEEKKERNFGRSSGGLSGVGLSGAGLSGGGGHRAALARAGIRDAHLKG